MSRPAELASSLPGTSVAWWHAASAETPAPEITKPVAQTIEGWVRAGGSLWLTLHAAALLPALRLEDRPPDEFGWRAWHHSETELEALEGERRGVVGFGRHPLFDGLAGGAMLLQPQAGRAYPQALYTAGIRGRVVAAEWQYLTIDPNRRVVLEHQLGQGRVLTVGAHLLFGEQPNPFRSSLERFAGNCLRYLGEPSQTERCYWPGIEFRPLAKELGDIARPAAGRSSAVQPALVDGRHALMCNGAGDWQFDLGVGRVVLIGKQRSGVREIWALPTRLVRNLTARFDGKAESEMLREFRRLPDSVQRDFEVNTAHLAQSISAKDGDAVLEYKVQIGELHSLDLDFEVDLRAFWPYPEGVLGRPRLERSGDDLSILDGEGAERGTLHFDPWPDELEIRSESGQARATARFDSPKSLRIAVRSPQVMTHPTLRTTNQDEPCGEPFLEVETPDEQFNAELFWAINGLRDFDIETPAGHGLVAGLAETGTGWWGGRLGYAWFFGRDTIWSSFACLGVGMHDVVRESLRLQARYQSPEGKIFHELTPGGIGHFDSADSTPLFLVGLDQYVRWTWDLELLADVWPAARNALTFCESTDRDRDGLIENTGVGHGWSEGGPVYGAHATFYLNACWAVALRSMARLANSMAEYRLARRCRDGFARVKSILNERFYRPEDGWFAYGVAVDGSMMPAKTIEPAVAALFGLLDVAKVETFFKEVASSRFTTPWGVRYIANDDPDYHPRGYHHGSVWPLFTGWVSAAEYACGRVDAAFRHARSSLALVRQRSLGAIEEVLDGDTGEPAGVCPHQLWSHAMTVMPIIEGMLGIRPNTYANRLVLRPQLPADWDFVRIRNLRVGAHLLSFNYERGSSGVELQMDRPRGLDVDFSA